MVDIQDIAFRIYGNNPYTNNTYLGSPKPWSNYQFNEDLIGSNVGANIGRGMNTTNSLRTAKLYAGSNGEVLPVNLLDDSYYYDINKPYNKQSELVQFFIEDPGTNKLNYNQYQQVLNQASSTPIAGLKNTNIPGEAAYVTINPNENAEIIAPFERGQRSYLSLDKLKQVGENYQKAKRLMGNYVAPVINNPITKALGKAASTIMKGANVGGNVLMLYDLGKRYQNFINQNPEYAPLFGQLSSPTRLYGGIKYYD